MPTRLEALELMVSRAPNDPFPYYGLALEYRSLNRLEDSLTAFDRLREKFPSYVPQYLMAAQVCQRLNRTADAHTWCTRGITIANASRDSHSVSELESFRSTLPPL